MDYNYHTHTYLCSHATGEIEDYIKTAIENGIKYMGFSEHFPIRFENGNILMLTSNTYCYLMVDDMPYGSFSAWISGENETALRRLEEYYSINPDKVPQYIYVPKGSGFDTAGIAATAQKKGYTLIENDVSYKLTKQ